MDKDFLTESKIPKSSTEFFNDYVKEELSKSQTSQIKMSKFFAYAINEKNHPIDMLSQQIQINNKNLKSLFFDTYNFYIQFSFGIINSDNLEIIINEEYKTNKFSMINCNNIDLIFKLESNQDGFVHQNNFSFEQCKFKTIDIKITSKNKYQFAFNCELNFLNCEIEKMGRIKNKKFNNNLTFENTIFKESVNFDDKIFSANVKFINCTFLKDISFNKAVFEKEVEFQDCVFNKADFSNAIFKDNVYFNNSKFDGIFMLYKAQFYKVADFVNIEFNDIYNFSSCVFKEPELINFIGFKTNINFEILENYIKEKECLQEKIILAENLKNSFAVIKHNLIQRNNLIEANKHKVLEFYMEELRLKNECGIKNQRCPIAFYESMRSIFTHSKQTINYLQLLFYRHTSDHHSDLLKSFHTMLLLIGLFAIFNYVIMIISNYNYSDILIFDPHNNLKLYKVSIDYFINTLPSYCLIAINSIIIIVFFLFFLGLLCLKNTMNKTIVIVSYVCSLLLLAISPKSIISITNLFSGNQHILDPLSALSGIYTILFILLIYSLQKTSRRNSIM